ncbi:MAG TPA: lactate racemase domain-containing protein [Terracidiphilus sp.]|nr:lactate racemase domain-containing protein [Terracidiphilus sp.]
MSLYLATGSESTDLSLTELDELLREALGKLGPRERVLAVPPDASRFHSRAGELTRLAWLYYGDRLKAVLPAIGTHTPMPPEQLARMFGEVPQHLFKIHNWRTDIETLGEIPAEFIREVSNGRLDFAWPAQVNKLISHGDGHGSFDLILSIGQVVPHEVMGMANYTKNILIGTGGRDGIDRSHYLSAVIGLENIMGRAENPVRSVLNLAADRYLRHLPIVYVLTVVGRAADSRLAVRGLFIGDDAECFHRAAELSVKVNIEAIDEPIRKAVVYLDPHEYHSTWIGNKAVYRTRMALTDGAELIILAPGVREFGEDRTIDSLIRKYGYRGTPATLKAVEQNADLAAGLGAAAHLIHASSEGRFKITWCPGHLTREEIESVGFEYGDLAEMSRRCDPAELGHGFNEVNGERIFFVANPGLGLWAQRSRLPEPALSRF